MVSLCPLIANPVPLLSYLASFAMTSQAFDYAVPAHAFSISSTATVSEFEWAFDSMNEQCLGKQYKLSSLWTYLKHFPSGDQESTGVKF
jgi:hypothetical protein